MVVTFVLSLASELEITDPPQVKSVPSNVKLELSSISPPDPAITTLLFVRSSTIRVFAVTPPLASTDPVKVESPATEKLVLFNN